MRHMLELHVFVPPRLITRPGGALRMIRSGSKPPPLKNSLFPLTKSCTPRRFVMHSPTIIASNCIMEGDWTSKRIIARDFDQVSLLLIALRTGSFWPRFSVCIGSEKVHTMKPWASWRSHPHLYGSLGCASRPHLRFALFCSFLTPSA